MSHRRDRLAHVVRDVVSDAIANRISDPRVSRFTSVTLVEVAPDMSVANVHVSVMGDETQARTTMKGLDSARGLIQSRLAKQVRMRTCPAIRFHLDMGIKRAIETYRSLSDIEADRTQKASPQSPGQPGDRLDGDDSASDRHVPPEVGE